MPGTATHPLTGHIAHLVDRLVEMARLFMTMPQANRFVATVAWGRMRRLGERFARLRARLAAGKLRPPRARSEDTPPTLADAAEGRPQVRVRVHRPPLQFLPRTFGWFARMVPGAGPVAQEFERLLADPEMPALLSVAPQAGLILRPLAHMLGVRRPVFLRLPRRRRVRTKPPAPRAAALQTAEPKPATGAPPPQPPPQPSRSPEEEAALAYARRPGGLYWNGTGFRWSLPKARTDPHGLRVPHQSAMKAAIARVVRFRSGRDARSSKACAPSPRGP
jgi:hypothetical protein